MPDFRDWGIPGLGDMRAGEGLGFSMFCSRAVSMCKDFGGASWATTATGSVGSAMVVV